MPRKAKNPKCSLCGRAHFRPGPQLEVCRRAAEALPFAERRAFLRYYHQLLGTQVAGPIAAQPHQPETPNDQVR